MLNKLIATLTALRADREQGATAVEYGLMVALIAAVILATVAALGGLVNGAFDAVVDALTGAGIGPAD